MEIYSGVIDVGFVRSLSEVYFPDPFARRGLLGNGGCTLVHGSLAVQNTVLFASQLAVLRSTLFVREKR